VGSQPALLLVTVFRDLEGPGLLIQLIREVISSVGFALLLQPSASGHAETIKVMRVAAFRLAAEVTEDVLQGQCAFLHLRVFELTGDSIVVHGAGRFVREELVVYGHEQDGVLGRQRLPCSVWACLLGAIGYLAEGYGVEFDLEATMPVKK